MRRSSALLVLISLSLLGLQASGLHVHVNADGYHGVPTAHHVHDGADGHLHDGDFDIWLAQPGTVAAKLLLALIPFSHVGLVHAHASADLVVNSHLPPVTDCRVRWRPPLRAPPDTHLLG